MKGQPSGRGSWAAGGMRRPGIGPYKYGHTTSQIHSVRKTTGVNNFRPAILSCFPFLMLFAAVFCDNNQHKKTTE